MKAEKRKVKKARQREARAVAAAQTAEVRLLSTTCGAQKCFVTDVWHAKVTGHTLCQTHHRPCRWLTCLLQCPADNRAFPSREAPSQGTLQAALNKYAESNSFLQAEGKENHEEDVGGGKCSASKQKQSADAQSAEGPPIAAPATRDSVPALGSLAALVATANSSKEASSSSDSSLSPQAALYLHHGQQEQTLSKRAQSAQTLAPAAQEEVSQQKMRPLRRQPVSQQTVSQASVLKAPKQGRGAPAQECTASSASDQRDFRAAAQHAEQAPLESQRPAMHLPAQSVYTAPKQLPRLVRASAGGQPQQPLNQGGPNSMQHLLSQLLPSSLPHQPLQMPQSRTAQAQHMPHSELSSGVSSGKQVRS